MKPPKGVLFDSRFFRRFVEIEASHFWFLSRWKVLSRLLGQITASLVPGYRVLEVGCGHGGMLGQLLKTYCKGKVFGLDLELEGLALAHGSSSAAVLQADIIMGSPFGQDFSVVCLFDVLEHIPDDRQVLRNLFGLLSEGGTLLLTVPAEPFLWSYFDVAVHHQRRYRLAELNEKLTTAGFEVEYLTSYMAALFPLLYLKRLWSGLAGRLRPEIPGKAYDLALGDLVAPHPFVNWIASLLLACEPGLIGRRLHLPMGTSLVALARRPVVIVEAELPALPALPAPSGEGTAIPAVTSSR